MKLLDIVKTIGAGVVREMVPGGGLLLEAVNQLLPRDKQLPANATGLEVQRAVDNLPADQRAQLLAREFDVQLAHIEHGNSTLRTMLEVDAKSPHTTRPYIARQAFHVVAFVIVVVVSVWAVGVLRGNSALVGAVTSGWPFVLAVIGPLVTLLWAYFGVLKTEHKNRLSAASGQPPGGAFAGLLSALLRR